MVSLNVIIAYFAESHIGTGRMVKEDKEDRSASQVIKIEILF